MTGEVSGRPSGAATEQRASETETRQLLSSDTSSFGGRYGGTSHSSSQYKSSSTQSLGNPQQAKKAADLQHQLHTQEESAALTVAGNGTLNTDDRDLSLYQQVKASFLEEVHEADNMDSFVLDMQTTRALSLLPKDIILAGRTQSFYSDVSEEEELDALSVENESALFSSITPNQLEHQPIPGHAYVLLVSAVVCLSTIGPFLELLDGVHPALKMYWRLTTTSLTLSRLAIWTVRVEGLPRLLPSQWGSLVLTAASYSIFLGAFVVSLNYTSVGNATIYSNTHSLLLLVGKVVLGQRVLFLEGSGALLAFGGAILCSLDSAGGHGHDNNDDNNGVWQSTVYGDFLAIISAIGALWYFVFAKTIRPHVSIYIFMFLNLFLSSILVLVFMVTTQVHFTLDRHVDHGIFGWTNLSWGRLGVQVATTLIPDLFGAMGYIRSMRYFDTLLISVATLGEPVAAELTAFAFGVGALPGLLGWVGNLLVAGGTLAVIYPTSTTTAKEQSKGCLQEDESDADEFV